MSRESFNLLNADGTLTNDFRKVEGYIAPPTYILAGYVPTHRTVDGHFASIAAWVAQVTVREIERAGFSSATEAYEQASMAATEVIESLLPYRPLTGRFTPLSIWLHHQPVDFDPNSDQSQLMTVAVRRGDNKSNIYIPVELEGDDHCGMLVVAFEPV